MSDPRLVNASASVNVTEATAQSTPHHVDSQIPTYQNGDTIYADKADGANISVNKGNTTELLDQQAQAELQPQRQPQSPNLPTPSSSTTDNLPNADTNTVNENRIHTNTTASESTANNMTTLQPEPQSAPNSDNLNGDGEVYDPAAVLPTAAATQSQAPTTLPFTATTSIPTDQQLQQQLQQQQGPPQHPPSGILPTSAALYTYEPDQKNVYAAGLPISWNESDIRELFGVYGEIVELSLMYETYDRSKSRGIAFIHFSKHDDARTSIENLNGITISGALKPLQVKFAKPKPDHKQDKDLSALRHKNRLEDSPRSSGMGKHDNRYYHRRSTSRDRDGDRSFGRGRRSRSRSPPSFSSRGGTDIRSTYRDRDRDIDRPARPTDAIDYSGEDDNTIYISRMPRGVTASQVEDLFRNYGPTLRLSVPEDNVTKRTKGIAFVKLSSRKYALQAMKDLDGSRPNNWQETLIVKWAERGRKESARLGLPPPPSTVLPDRDHDRGRDRDRDHDRDSRDLGRSRDRFDSRRSPERRGGGIANDPNRRHGYDRESDGGKTLPTVSYSQYAQNQSKSAAAPAPVPTSTATPTPIPGIDPNMFAQFMGMYSQQIMQQMMQQMTAQQMTPQQMMAHMFNSQQSQPQPTSTPAVAPLQSQPPAPAPQLPSAQHQAQSIYQQPPPPSSLQQHSAYGQQQPAAAAGAPFQPAHPLPQHQPSAAYNQPYQGYQPPPPPHNQYSPQAPPAAGYATPQQQQNYQLNTPNAYQQAPYGNQGRYSQGQGQPPLQGQQPAGSDANNPMASYFQSYFSQPQ